MEENKEFSISKEKLRTLKDICENSREHIVRGDVIVEWKTPSFKVLLNLNDILSNSYSRNDYINVYGKGWKSYIVVSFGWPDSYDRYHINNIRTDYDYDNVEVPEEIKEQIKKEFLETFTDDFLDSFIEKENNRYDEKIKAAEEEKKRISDEYFNRNHKEEITKIPLIDRIIFWIEDHILEK